MTARRKMVYATPLCSFNSQWFAPIFDQYIDFEPYDPGRTYDSGTLFYTNCLNYRVTEPGGTARGQDYIDQLREQGFRVIIDNLWEVDFGPVESAFTVKCDRFFWYNESLWYSHLGYDQYRPARTAQYRALMPMNKLKPHRTDFLSRIDTGGLLWSYVEQGTQLPWDQDMGDWTTQRYMNPAWYDRSYCSVVVETVVRAGSRYTPVFITEKTMKPLAFQHPLIVYGNRGVLAALKSWGFETFSNLWDESYDSVIDVDQRRDAVASIVNSVEIQDYSAETQAKLTHNRNLFFDRSRVVRGIVSEIIEPLLEYAER